MPAAVPTLDRLHHVAVEADDIETAVEWYQEHFSCRVAYQDDTWALLKFANVSLALVTPGQHPPHLGFVHPEAAKFGELKPHRDGTESLYLSDPHGNAVELLSTKGIDE
ncbi:VOC family protein [Alienimonas sp. DA493]|uniref:VOC family protein n=1 Tax=Alienimonas sp. DA493 TaxID=3373605 RepID=UPI003754E325